MARFPRVVVPDVPHLLPQRGARRAQVFFSEDAYRSYAQLLARQAHHHALDMWTFCLMSDHVHLIVVPSSKQGLARPLGEAHHRYALEVNRRHR